MADNEKFLVVPLGKESKAITQTVSNDTAMEIMELLAEGPMSTSGVAEKLSIPLTTAQYNIEKLMDAGLVKIARTKYSEKGREVKLYEAMNRAIIILPGKSGTGAVMDALKRYILVLPVVALASLAVEYLVPLTQTSRSADESLKSAGTGPYLMNAMPTAGPSAVAVPASSALDQGAQSVTILAQHAGLLFFAGCLLVMLLLIVLEYAKYSRPSKKKP
ncbi:MAG TPA: winged helix-turn-helix domain-containing protein [Methanocella sp.]|uniref:ArsR/SmtB family transcription factor n=1 Tax=Methanocella sp. TaxID=2052833 RepID=UPI002CEF3811|nr:winged helix-turn-helix domain-containing protein [Methanocella sp.]HTY91698.1 winged helix-turn-helix domain-containing protein [Methanocella sp.]